ncbi:MAG TPA: type I-MYXAN CRISPR-associated protein Cas6/Cmx6 [Gallionellaceae bacterium]
MSEAGVPEIVEVVFDLKAERVHGGYAFSLWDEVVRCLPWLENVEHAGIVPLKGSASGEDTLLSQRTKLVLRLPVNHAEKALELCGQQLNVGGSVLQVGNAKVKSLLPANTLHAQMVESSLGEVEFLAAMQGQLQAMNVPCKLICDKHVTIKNTDQQLTGYGLVLHDLKPAASLLIQSVGLGGARRYGCGMFVHFKAITGLD